MKKTLLLCGALLALTAATASAAPAINLAWTDCIDGPTATLNKAFACNVNTGSDVMFVSFVAPGGIDQFISVEIYGEAQAQAAATPAWWQLKGTTACRNNQLSLNGDFSENSACDASNWGGVATGGIGAVSNDTPTPGHQMWNGVVAVTPSSATPLVADVHYYGVKISLSHQKTVGTGACAGCTTPVCFRLARLKVVQPSGAPGGNVDITTVGTRAHVTYQGASEATCIGATPTRNSTWGAVKNLYR